MLLFSFRINAETKQEISLGSDNLREQYMYFNKRVKMIETLSQIYMVHFQEGMQSWYQQLMQVLLGSCKINNGITSSRLLSYLCIKGSYCRHT